MLCPLYPLLWISLLSSLLWSWWVSTCNFELDLCSTPSLYSLFGTMAGGDAVPAPVEQPAVFSNIESVQGLCSTPSPLLSTGLETWLMVMLLQLLLSSLLWSLLFFEHLGSQEPGEQDLCSTPSSPPLVAPWSGCCCGSSGSYCCGACRWQPRAL